jgi:anti-sigma factor RsiW
MMCPEERQLQRFSDGELSDRQASQIAGHVDSCPQCAAALRRLENVHNLVSGAIRKETRAHDLTGLWEKVRQGIAAPAPRPGFWEILSTLLLKPAAKLAYAGLIVFLGAFILLRSFLPSGSDQKPALVRRAQVDSVASYSPEVAVSVVLAYEDRSAVVWITGLNDTKEN